MNENTVFLQGSDNSRNTAMLVRIESNVFETESDVSGFIPKVFAYLTNETCLMEDEIQVVMMELPLWRMGIQGKALKCGQGAKWISDSYTRSIIKHNANRI